MSVTPENEKSHLAEKNRVSSERHTVAVQERFASHRQIHGAESVASDSGGYDFMPSSLPLNLNPKYYIESA